MSSSEKSSSERDVFEAAARNDLVRVRHLCETTNFKAVTGVDGKSHTPLHWASLNNAMRVAQYLIDNGAKTDVRLPARLSPKATNRSPARSRD